MTHEPVVAFFSMEIELDPAIPTYSGGLGVLAGDMLRASADLGVPTIGVTLVYRMGYSRQHLDEDGNQSESPLKWSPEKVLEPLDELLESALDQVERCRIANVDRNEPADHKREFCGARYRTLLGELCVAGCGQARLRRVDDGRDTDRDCDDDVHAERSVLCAAAVVLVIDSLG